MGNPNDSETLAQQFKRIYHERDHSVVLPCADNPNCIRIADPSILASFVAFCSGPCRPVFLRGETRYFPNSVPSLFRNAESESKRRWAAYRLFLNKLKELRPKLEGSRWETTKTLGAVLQHYGIRTPWLDVVRNIYTAVWFATHDFETRGSCLVATPSEREHGYLSIYDARAEGKAWLRIVDLWGNDSSRHFRPHAQHGLSLAKQDDDGAPPGELDLEPYRIAHVCFPNSPKWTLCGHLFSSRFLFPAPEYDDSLKQLSRPEVQTILNEACTTNNLPFGTLGTVSHYM